MAMILSCAAVLHYAADAGHGGAQRGIYESVLEATAAGPRTPDLGGSLGITAFTDEVIGRVRTKVDVWASLGPGI